MKKTLDFFQETRHDIGMNTFRMLIAAAVVAAAYFLFPHGMWIVVAICAGYGLTAAHFADKERFGRFVRKRR